MAKKTEIELNLGRVVLFRNYQAKSPEEFQLGDKDVCEILDVTDDQGDYIKAGYYLLPKSDATVLTNEDGLVYVYNVSVPYLDEVAHLAKVEENIIIGQAFLYPGRNMPKTGPNGFQWALVILMFLLGAFAIFAG
ncbi:hypothetical protein D1872_178970 [compost metagenome]